MTKGEPWPDPLLTFTCSPSWFLRTLQTPFHCHLVLVPLPLYLVPLIPSSDRFWSLSHPTRSLSLLYIVWHLSCIHTCSFSNPCLNCFPTTLFSEILPLLTILSFWDRSRKEEKDLVMSSALNCKKLMRSLGYRGLKNLHERWIELTTPRMSRVIKRCLEAPRLRVLGCLSPTGIDPLLCCLH